MPWSNAIAPPAGSDLTRYEIEQWQCWSWRGAGNLSARAAST
jgi:hypothetical protein